MTTYFQSTEEAHAGRKWVLVDAAGLTVGRAASQIAHIIRGKHRPTFTRHVDGGDFVIVINAEKVKFTGNKLSKKMYHTVSGYIGGTKSVKAADVMTNEPERILRDAVEGMLPGGVLGHQLRNKLKIYRGSEHHHQAQNPEVINLG